MPTPESLVHDGCRTRKNTTALNDPARRPRGICQREPTRRPDWKAEPDGSSVFTQSDPIRRAEPVGSSYGNQSNQNRPNMGTKRFERPPTLYWRSKRDSLLGVASRPAVNGTGTLSEQRYPSPL